MRTFRYTVTLTTLLLSSLLALLVAGPADAADSSKVEVDKKTGVITFAATNLSGLAGWRDSASEEVSAFYFPGCVISDNDMIGCPLADPATKQATVPPPSCSVCIEDGTGKDCCARIKGCTPGARDCTIVATNEPVAANSYGEAMASCPVGYRVTGGGASHHDPFDLQEVSVSLPTASGDGWSCEGYNSSPFNASISCQAVCCRLP
jgi:hypothetical protein